MQAGTTRRHFTEAARMAAAAARKRKAEEAVHSEHTVYVTRDPDDVRRYAWEVRRFGGLVVARSPCTFGDDVAARRAGEAELGRLALY